MLRFMGSQRVGHDQATELNWGSPSSNLKQPTHDVKIASWSPRVLYFKSLNSLQKALNKQTNKQKTTKRPNPVTYLNFPNRLGRKTPLYNKYFRYRSLVEKNSSNHKNVQILLISMNFKVWMQPEVLKNSVFGAHQIHYLVFINLHICFTFSRW